MSPSPLCGGIVVFQFYPHKNQCKIAWARVGGVLGVSCFPLGCSGWPRGGPIYLLGGFWGSLGCPLGASLVPPECLLGVSWVPVCLFGASWVPSGCFLGAGLMPIGSPLAHLSCLGASWASPGASWVTPGCILGVSWVSSWQCLCSSAVGVPRSVVSLRHRAGSLG